MAVCWLTGTIECCLLYLNTRPCIWPFLHAVPWLYWLSICKKRKSHWLSDCISFNLFYRGNQGKTGSKKHRGWREQENETSGSLYRWKPIVNLEHPHRAHKRRDSEKWRHGARWLVEHQQVEGIWDQDLLVAISDEWRNWKLAKLFSSSSYSFFFYSRDRGDMWRDEG